MVYGADRGAAAEVAGYDFQVFPVFADHLGATLGHEAVARAVESVAADAVLLVVLVGYAVEIVFRLDAEVERRVEHRHLRHVGHHVIDGLCTHDVARNMQRRQVDKRLLLVDDVARNLHALREILAAVGEAVAHGPNLLDARDDTRLGIHQRIHHKPQTLRVVGYRALAGVLLTLAGVAEDAARQTDALQQSFGHNGARINVNQLILKRRAAAVENQDLHKADNLIYANNGAPTLLLCLSGKEFCPVSIKRRIFAPGNQT